MSNRIIAIGRQFGSGGRTIGKKVAERLGIPCYDNEILERMAMESGYTTQYVKEQSEFSVGRNWLSHAIFAGDGSGNPSQDALWALQNKIIHELAEQGPCVFVGFCSEYILRNHENCLRVFIHADLEKRAKRIVEQYGETNETPEKRLKDKDRRRATYYQFYTGLKWGNSKNYHVTLNSGTLGIDQCVDILTGLY